MLEFAPTFADNTPTLLEIFNWLGIWFMTEKVQQREGQYMGI